MKRFFPWPGLIFVFIGTTVLVQGTTLFFALGDDSHAVVPDYDAKADAWDEHAADLASSEALGWTVEVVDSQLANGGMDLTLQLGNFDGTAHGTYRAHHNATPNALHADTAHVDEHGTLPISVAGQRTGWWQLELHLQQGDHSFVWRDKTWLPLGTEPEPEDAS